MLAACLPMQIISSGGSSETEVKLLAVKPRGWPSTPAVVTMVTPVMKLPKAERSSRLSKLLRRSARKVPSNASVAPGAATAERPRCRPLASASAAAR